MSKQPETLSGQAGRLLPAAHGYAAFPTLTEYESKVFRIFARRHTPGYHDNAVQLEGDKRLPIVAAGFRLIRKGVLSRHRSCHWYLTDLGRRMAVEWQRHNPELTGPFGPV